MSRGVRWILGILVVLLAVALVGLGYLFARLDSPSRNLVDSRRPPLVDEKALSEARVGLSVDDASVQTRSLMVLSALSPNEATEWARNNLSRRELFGQCVSTLFRNDRYDGNDVHRIWSAYQNIPDRAEDSYTVSTMLDALKLASDPRFVDVATEGLSSSRREVKGAVVASLASGIRIDVAIPLLIRAMEDPSMATMVRSVLMNSFGAPDNGLDAEAWRQWWAGEVAKGSGPQPTTNAPSAEPPSKVQPTPAPVR